MTIELDRVDSRWIGQTFARDADIQLPERPRLIPELIVLPYSYDGFVFVGAEHPQVIRGRSARSLLPALLPELTGARTLNELASALPHIPASHLRDVVSLLYSRGLLENGGASDEDEDAFSDTKRFLGRYIDVSRSNRNRKEAFERVSRTSVRIFGSAVFADLLRTDLCMAGVRDVRHISDGEESGSADFAIWISTDREEDRALAATAARSAHRQFAVRLGRAEAHIGPLFLGGVTTCPDCVAAVHPHPVGEPLPDLASYWIALAGLTIFQVISAIAPGGTHRGFRVFRVDEAGQLTQETRVAPPLPGCTVCGLQGVHFGPDDPRMLAWIYHCATTFVSRELLSPKDHQMHYLMANMKLAEQPQTALPGSTEWRLPPPLPLGADSARLPTDSRCSQAIGASELATLLARGAGELDDAGVRRRIAPTGGNLGSVELWVVATEESACPRGVYRYNARQHALERVHSVSDRQVAAALRASGAVPALAIIGTGALAKCAQKYQGFAYRLIFFDSGVALSYLSAVAESLGVDLHEFPDFSDAAVAELLGLPHRWESPMPTFVLGVGPYDTRSELVPYGDDALAAPRPRATPEDYSFDMLPRLLDAVDSEDVRGGGPESSVHLIVRTSPRWAGTTLDDVMVRRRAIRRFSASTVDPAIARGVMIAAAAVRGRRLRDGAPPCFVRPVLAVSRGTRELPEGLYELDAGQHLVRRADFGPQLAAQCVNQHSLAVSPIALHMIADLDAALRERGLRAYREQAQHAGAAIADAWLTATADRLVGSAGAGLIADGFRRAANMDGLRDCPLIALFLGRPFDR